MHLLKLTQNASYGVWFPQTSVQYITPSILEVNYRLSRPLFSIPHTLARSILDNKKIVCESYKWDAVTGYTSLLHFYCGYVHVRVW